MTSIGGMLLHLCNYFLDNVVYNEVVKGFILSGLKCE